jgi:hypothetical protein
MCMTQHTHLQPLQHSYRQFIYPYAQHITFAVTLTMKMRAKIRVKRFDNYGDEYYEYWVTLDDEKIRSTIDRFTARLTALLYGNHARHKNKRAWATPLLIVAVEGRNTHKREHLHLALGNIPDAKRTHIESFIKQAWADCDFGYKQTETKLLFDGYGWLDYMTKEVGYTDNDALDVASSTIPKFIQDSICTESRLLTA